MARTKKQSVYRVNLEQEALIAKNVQFIATLDNNTHLYVTNRVLPKSIFSFEPGYLEFYTVHFEMFYPKVHTLFAIPTFFPWGELTGNQQKMFECAFEETETQAMLLKLYLTNRAGVSKSNALENPNFKDSFTEYLQTWKCQSFIDFVEKSTYAKIRSTTCKFWAHSYLMDRDLNCDRITKCTVKDGKVFISYTLEGSPKRACTILGLKRLTEWGMANGAKHLGFLPVFDKKSLERGDLEVLKYDIYMNESCFTSVSANVGYVRGQVRINVINPPIEESDMGESIDLDAFVDNKIYHWYTDKFNRDCALEYCWYDAIFSQLDRHEPLKQESLYKKYSSLKSAALHYMFYVDKALEAGLIRERELFPYEYALGVTFAKELGFGFNPENPQHKKVDSFEGQIEKANGYFSLEEAGLFLSEYSY
jgi:hypothetical protein